MSAPRVLHELIDKAWDDGFSAGFAAAAARVTKALSADTPRPPMEIVLAAIEQFPGLKGTAVLASIRDGGHALNERTFRTCLHRLKQAPAKIVARDGGWHPAVSAEGDASNAS